MEKSIRNMKKILAIAVVVSVVTAAQAYAGISLGISSGEAGFGLNFDIPLIGKQNIQLNDVGDSAFIPIGILFIKLVNIELSLNDISDKAVNIHYDVNSPFFGPVAGDLPVPFAEIGADIDLGGKILSPAKDHSVDASVVITKNKSKYDVAVNLPGLYEGDFEGSEVNNMIHEEVENPFGEGLLAEIDLELEHVNKFITMVTYDIAINIPGMPGAAQFPPQDDMEHGDDPNGGQPGLRGTIPIPNGSYHIWFDLDLNMDMQPFPGGDEFPPEDQPPEGEEMM